VRPRSAQILIIIIITKNLWEGSSMQPELSNGSCGSRIFLCLHAELVAGQKLKIEGRHARVEQRQALCRTRGIWGPRNVGSRMSGGIKDIVSVSVTMCRNESRSECTLDACKTRRWELENELKQTRREVKLREEQMRQMERDAQVNKLYIILCNIYPP